MSSCLISLGSLPSKSWSKNSWIRIGYRIGTLCRMPSVPFDPFLLTQKICIPLVSYNFSFYCNFWLNLEYFYPVTLDMYFYLMSNKDHYNYYYCYLCQSKFSTEHIRKNWDLKLYECTANFYVLLFLARGRVDCSIYLHSILKFVTGWMRERACSGFQNEAHYCFFIRTCHLAFLWAILALVGWLCR